MKVFVQSVCDKCGGDGFITRLYELGHGSHTEKCPSCEGKGYINEWIDIKELQEALNKK